MEQTDDLKELGKDEVKDRARVLLEQNLADLNQSSNCCTRITLIPC